MFWGGCKFSDLLIAKWKDEHVSNPFQNQFKIVYILCKIASDTDILVFPFLLARSDKILKSNWLKGKIVETNVTTKHIIFSVQYCSYYFLVFLFNEI